MLNKYQPLHSTDILAAAGTLISKVKSHNYGDKSKVPEEFYESIDQLALAFSSRLVSLFCVVQCYNPEGYIHPWQNAFNTMLLEKQ